MSDTQIEWTHWPDTIGATWNPVTGCNKVDRGCKNCYAEVMHKRLQAMGQEKYLKDFSDGPVAHDDTLLLPLRWKKPRTVFVNSMSDLFHKDLPFWFIKIIFSVMEKADKHTFLILTKRPEIALQFWSWMRTRNASWTCPRNVLMGTSVHDQESAEKRVITLLHLDNVKLFLSYEPALGPLDLEHLKAHGEVWNALDGSWLAEDEGHGELGNSLAWVICGGESGHKAQPLHPDWARSVRDQCVKYETPFFFKQWGRWEPYTYYVDNKPVLKFDTGENEFIFTEPYRPQNMRKTRRKDAHELDGRVWQQFPGLKPIQSTKNLTPCPSLPASTTQSAILQARPSTLLP